MRPHILHIKKSSTTQIFIIKFEWWNIKVPPLKNYISILYKDSIFNLNCNLMNFELIRFLILNIFIIYYFYKFLIFNIFGWWNLEFHQKKDRVTYIFLVELFKVKYLYCHINFLGGGTF